MEKFTHNCIKCRMEYVDENADAYYCENCNNNRLAVAREIDARVGSTVGQTPGGELKAYESAAKVHGFVITKL